MTKNRTCAAIAIVLLLVITMSIFALPAATAQLNDPYVSTGTFKTQAFIGALPNPVGVGQEVLLHIGIQQQLSSVDRGWYGMSVTIERPDGKVDTIADIKTDSTGGTGRVYVPPIAGKYYLQSHFPEQRMPTTAGGIPANTTMLESDSPKLELVVQEDPIPYYPATPLPTEFWTRPINAQLREWSAISGSSWMDNEYNEAPESPHVLWTKPLTMGGLVGGDIGEHSFEHGDAYEGKWPNRWILAGRLYYTAGPYERPVITRCVDLRSGEELWAKTLLDNRTISTAQTFYWDNFNYHGTFDYLWVVVGSNWTAFDAFTGEPSFMFYSVPSGSNIYGPNGEICRYSISLSRGYMTLWNSTIAGLRGASGMSAGSWGSRVANREINATDYGMQYNITIPSDLPGSVRGVKLDDKVVGTSTTTEEVNLWAFSLKPGQEGQLLYNKTWKAPNSWTTNNVTFYTYGSSWALTDLDANIGLIWAKEELLHYAFDLNTGEFLWKADTQHPYLDTYSIGRRIEYGKMYSVGQAGQIHCWNATTGKLLWIYNATDPYTEFLWGNYWSEDLLFIQGGKLYFFHSEHSPVNPLFRGAPAICLDAETGEEIWRVDGLFRKTDWGGSPIMGDSVIALYNSYDQQVYAVGKGPSSTTVEAPMTAVALGETMVIRGTVTDVSPGTGQTSLMLRFPNGVPAVSDQSMGEWMKYVYAQFPRPTSATGVPVTIDVIDSNGNYRNIGTVTSDASGMFTFAWQPDIEGEYKVIATFTGSGAYYPSFAESSFFVGPAPAVPADPEPIPISNTDTYVMYSAVGIIVAIAIVGALLALLFRKRP